MADDNDNVTWKLNLDNTDLAKKALESKQLVQAIGDSKNLDGLLGGLIEAAPLVGTLGVAFFALKTTIDAVFDGEKIEQVTQQFKILTENAGLMGDKLKESLEKSSDGLVSEHELLQATNKAIIELGANAKDLAQIMDLARKVTAAGFGTDLLSNFEALNQAISTGQTRMLKHLGIVVDQQKAYRDYAAAIGATVDTLSLAGKQEAVMQAVLAKGDQTFKGVNLNLTQNINLWQQTKAVVKDVGDILSVLIEKTIGGKLATALSFASQKLVEFKNYLHTTFGTDTQAQMQRSQKEITALVDKLELWKKYQSGEIANGHSQAEINQVIAKTTQDIIAKRHELMALQGQGQELRTKEIEQEKALAAQSKGGATDPDLKAKQEAKFYEELTKLKAQALKESERNAEDELTVQRNMEQEKLVIAEEAVAKKAQLEAEAKARHITPEQAAQLEVQIEEIKNQKIKALDDQLRSHQEKALDLHTARAKTASDGFARAFADGSRKAALELQNFGKMGEKAFTAVGSRAKQAFIDMGSGAKSGGEAMKGFMFNVLGDIAEQQGEMLLLEGIWPPNPAALGAGAALLALSGYLHAQGGGGGGGGGSYGGGGGGGGYASGPTPGTGGAAGAAGYAPAQAAQKASLEVHIHGNMYNEEQTRTALMDMMRQVQDMSDYNLVKIGSS